MVNTALATSFAASGVAGNTPYFFFNPATQLFSLVVDTATFAPTQTGPVPPVPIATIFLNTQMLNFLEAIELQFFGYNQPQGRDFEFKLVRFGNDELAPVPPFVAPFGTQKIFTQEYKVVSFWSSIRKILITTNSIPIISEYTPTNNSGISSTLPIISDFTPQIENASDIRSIAFYTPSAQYRLADMKSSEQLNTIDLKIFWQDKNLNIFPVFISVFQQANVKLGFFKKTLYKKSLITA